MKQRTYGSRALRWLLAAGLLFGLAMLCGCQDRCLHIHIEESTIVADCDHAGYTLRRCADCGIEYRESLVPPTEHVLSTTVTLPTCASEGYTTYACQSCDYTYRADWTAPLSHVLHTTVIPPTCTGGGYTTVACKNCTFFYTINPIPAQTHDEEETVTPPTCNTAGYTEYRCRVCGHSRRDAYVESMGHSFEKEVFGPTTCVTTGYTRYSCTECEVSYIGDYVFYSDVFEGAYGASETPLAGGVDISKYNHLTDAHGKLQPLDFEAIAAAGYEFVILKIGSTPRPDGVGGTKGGLEPTFEADYEAAKAAGLDVGVYFYTYSDTPESAAADAARVMEWLGERTLEYPVYFDIEQSSLEALGRRAVTDLCISFISTLQANRYFGALYTNNRWLTSVLQTDKVTFLFDIWYARYPSGDGPYTWNTEKYGPQVGMWQYTQSGKIEGLPASLTFDLNYAYKDYPTLIQAFGYNGYGSTQETPNLPTEGEE